MKASRSFLAEKCEFQYTSGVLNAEIQAYKMALRHNKQIVPPLEKAELRGILRIWLGAVGGIRTHVPQGAS